ncbi:Transthyretin-like protein 3, partial [Trichinella pseudospiralis]
LIRLVNCCWISIFSFLIYLYMFILLLLLLLLLLTAVCCSAHLHCLTLARMKLFLFLFTVFGILYTSCALLGRMQRVVAKGKLFCGAKPASGVKVKLIDIDTGFDDVMDEKRTNANGEFHVDGQTSEITDIDPVLKIYHDCHDGKPCQRRWKVEIPKRYIASPNKQPNVFELGTINLEAYWHDEERNCV